MKRGRKKNGAELLLMGANPHSRSKQREARERAVRIKGARLNNPPQPNRLNNPLLNANFTTAQKMELGRLGIAWTSIQTPADAKRARKALKDAAEIRRRFNRSRNPMPAGEQRTAATEIYSGFHAAPPENKIVLDEPHIPAGTYPELGLLLSISFKPTNKDAKEHYEKNYVCERENIHVIGSLDREQIYFAGGDQRIDAATLKYFGWGGPGGSDGQNFQLGDARKIVYLARKYHSAVQENARGELVEWVHEFGEESGALPQLYYDTVAHRIYLKHGEYEIRDEGITN